MVKGNEDVNVEDYLEVENQTVTSKFLSDDDIVSSVQQTGESTSFGEDNVDTEEPHAMVSTKEAQDTVLTLRRSFEQQDGADFGVIVKLDHAVKTHTLHAMGQSHITDFYVLHKQFVLPTFNVHVM